MYAKQQTSFRLSELQYTLWQVKYEWQKTKKEKNWIKIIKNADYESLLKRMFHCSGSGHNSALGVSLLCHPSSVFQCPLVYHTSSVLYFHSFTCTCKCLLLPQCVTNQKEHNMGLQFSQLPTPLSFSYPFLVSALQFPGSKLAAEEASLAAAVCDIRKKDSNSRH